jgi:hypothetical protein
MKMSRIFEEYEIFKTMHPVKIKVMRELEENMTGKDLKQAMPYLLAATNELKENNLSFSKEEIRVLMEILTKDMTPQEKTKVEMMKNIMRKR